MNWTERIENRNVTIGIIGLGYVGLPLALAFAKEDFEVLGFDVDEEKVRKLRQGESPIPDIASDRIADVIESGTFDSTTDMARLASVDVVSICVPTPLRKSRDPDISYIAEATETIVNYFEPPGLVVLESTTYPGTTEEILSERFRNVGWDLTEEVQLAFSPERIDPSNEEFSLRNTPKVVGGYSEDAGNLTEELYGTIVDDIVRVSNTKAAEMVKLLENTFRSINIGLANEMALVCERLGIDVWEVIDAASTKPYGFMPFYPGPGLGGHCIPVDPLFLSWKAELADTQSRFVELADEVNRSMPDHVVQKTTEALNEDEKCVNGAEICILGVAYKSNVDDVRESPAHEIISRLRELHADLTYCDPYVDSFTVDGETVESVDREELADRSYDLGLIVTNHDRFDWPHDSEQFPLLVDTRNALSELRNTTSARVVVL